MGRFGMPELVLILFILLLLFGASKLPEIARSMGQSINEFKKTMNAKEDKGKADKSEEQK
ncbi:MAG: twin-arginine translocase TatA/TatE family subunit [Candidatus Omnitrophica bacterium]|nr:twin-arginine translocase TatA/TatE family subunit [Candidatus Omnitrophota bacterium]